MGQKVSLQLSFANFTPYKWERASNEPGLLSCWELPEAVEPFSVTKSEPIQFPSDSVTEHGINVDSIEVLSQKPLCNPITTYNFVDEKGERRKIEICGSLESKTIFAVVNFPTQNTNDKTVDLISGKGLSVLRCFMTGRITLRIYTRRRTGWQTIYLL